jgi:heme-degrading monooxygenase HmoA
MPAKILIKRKFKEGNTPQIVNLLNDMRRLAMSYPGYQSGETLVQKGSIQSMVVISTWQSMEEWQAWRDSQDRKKFESMLEVYQEGKTVIEEYLVGSPLHE